MVEDRASRTRVQSTGTRNDALIDEAGKESFPASDPPSTWSGEDPRDLDEPEGAEG